MYVSNFYLLLQVLIVLVFVDKYMSLMLEQILLLNKNCVCQEILGYMGVLWLNSIIIIYNLSVLEDIGMLEKGVSAFFGQRTQWKWKLKIGL